MGKGWKNHKRFINDWAKIWIWCISLITFVNMIMMVNNYAKQKETELINDFNNYCNIKIEEGVNDYDITGILNNLQLS